MQLSAARSPRRKRLVVKTQDYRTRHEIDLALNQMLFTGSETKTANVTPVEKVRSVQERFAVDIRGEQW